MYVCIVECSLFCVIDTIKCKQQQIILFTFYIYVDISGKVHIWDTVNKEHILKFECQPFAGPIRDICWDPDSKRIAVCGQGRETIYK